MLPPEPAEVQHCKPDPRPETTKRAASPLREKACQGTDCESRRECIVEQRLQSVKLISVRCMHVVA